MEVAIKRNSVFLISLILLAVFLFGHSKAERKPVSDKLYFPKEAVSEKILENGLTILTKSVPSCGLVSIRITIRAGASLEEEYLASGISHLVEHMVFKGTNTRAAGEIEKEVKSYGGFINGSVSQDLTEFHVTLPSKYLPQAVSLLKDMLLNAQFDKDEFTKEKEVILKEIRLNNDEPQSRIFRLLNQTAYLRHPYKYPTIGYEKNFAGLAREDALKYYNRMYVPNRMVISVVGGIDEGGAVEFIEKEFKDFRPPDYNAARPVYAEPVQIAARFAEEEMPINLTYLAMAFHSTSLLDRDLFAMDALSAILGRGDNSRLNTALFKNKRLVHNISCWNYTPIDPGLFVVSAVLDKEKLASSERSIIEEIDRIKEGGAEDEELAAVKRMVLSDFIFSLQTTDQQSGDLAANYILSGSYDFSRRYVDGIQAVSKEDIKRVANTYLRPDNLTTVRLAPAGPGKAAGVTAQEPERDTIKKVKLENGITILARESKKTPTISMSVVMLGGLAAENKDTSGISNLMANMLLKGTRLKKESEIKGVVEARGGSIGTFSGLNSFGINIELLKTDIDADLAIVKDILMNSQFPPDELEKAKILTLAAIRDEDDDIFQRGVNSLKKALFAGTPYAFRQLGTNESIESLTRAEIINYYRAYCAANNMVIAISGDIAADEAIAKLKNALGSLEKKKASIPAAVQTRLDGVKRESFEMDREESLLMFGFKSVGAGDPDKYAIEVMTSILSGQSGRMFGILRNKQSLAYTLGCFQRVAIDTGFIAFYIATVKDEIAPSRLAIIGEIQKIRDGDIGEDEISAAKRELIAGRQINMQTNSYYSFTSAIDELYGPGYDSLYKYESEIEKVTKEDVKRVAVKYLDLNAYAEIVISSKK